jgi:hypothetical protein
MQAASCSASSMLLNKTRTNRARTNGADNSKGVNALKMAYALRCVLLALDGAALSHAVRHHHHVTNQAIASMRSPCTASAPDELCCSNTAKTV